jgi:CysZ protein
MVSTSSSPRAAASTIFSGLETDRAAGHSSLRHSAAVDQHYSDGRRVLVAVHKLDSWIPSLMSHVPDWLQWLNYLLWPVVVISVLLVWLLLLDDRQLDSRAV